MIKVMARKNKTSLAGGCRARGPRRPGLSRGRHREHRARGQAHARSRRDASRSTRDDLEAALNDFIPSAQGLEKEKQELAAVLECTSMSFLPERWRSRVAQPDGRAKLQERMAVIRRLIEE